MNRSENYTLGKGGDGREKDENSQAIRIHRGGGGNIDFHLRGEQRSGKSEGSFVLKASSFAGREIGEYQRLFSEGMGLFRSPLKRKAQCRGKGFWGAGLHPRRKWQKEKLHGHLLTGRKRKGGAYFRQGGDYFPRKEV